MVFLFSFLLGAKHFFEKMNIGDLTISDYLGTLKRKKEKNFALLCSSVISFNLF